MEVHADHWDDNDDSGMGFNLYVRYCSLSSGGVRMGPQVGNRSETFILVAVGAMSGRDGF